MARRSGHYVPRTANMICEQIAMGKSLKQALELIGYVAPRIQSVWRWLDEHPEFREKYDRARQMQADTLADEMLELREQVIKNPKAASAYKVSGDIIKWQAEVRNRGVYGAKGESAAKKPMDPAKIKAEIERLQKELGVAETKVQPIRAVK